MKRIRIVEVGPRDGLQSINSIIPTKQKVEYIDRLTLAGLSEIEVTSFVSQKWVPQLADSFDVSNDITKDPAITYTALVPNEKGLDMALDADYTSISILASTSETFSKKNTNSSILDGFDMLDRAKHKWLQNSLRVRGYISTCLLYTSPSPRDLSTSRMPSSA